MDGVLSTTRVVNQCFHQSLLQYAAQVVPSSSLLPLPPYAAFPSQHDATFPWQAREHLPEGDFTIPITLTTAQIKPCHLNHKQQSNSAGELKQSNRKEKRGKRGGAGRERETGTHAHAGAINKTQSPMPGLGKCREAVQLEGGVRRQTRYESSISAHLVCHLGKVTYPVSSCSLICRMEFIIGPNS